MSIDKAKGIICKPMPRTWHDRHTVNKIQDVDAKNFNRRIVADKKPYFMRYIYPALMKQYNTYIKNTNCNALREFQLTVPELLAMPYEELTDKQRDFLYYYSCRMPVGVGDCVMNKICRRFEETFDGYVSKHADKQFDYSIMKSDAEYSTAQFYAVKKLYAEYNKRLQSYKIFTSYERVDKDASAASLIAMDEEFRRECSSICPDRKALCNIVLDLCYKRSSTKKFAWDMCGHEIINNLLAANGYRIAYPTADNEGEITYGGNNYIIEVKELCRTDGDYTEGE